MQQLDMGHADQAGSAAVQAAAQTLPTFGMQQVLELYRNSLKLASENKITKDNTWGLDLIDHMSDLVKPSDEEQGQTNFQRASCTLDAGVKIYSYRVDSVHNSIYKTLGGLSRTAAPSQQDDAGKSSNWAATTVPCHACLFVATTLCIHCLQLADILKAVSPVYACTTHMPTAGLC